MLFKNAFIYIFDNNQITQNDIENVINSNTDRLIKISEIEDCSLSKIVNQPFYSANKCTLFGLERRKKIIPPSAIKKELEKRSSIVEAGGKKISKKEKRILKESVINDLIRVALDRITIIYGYIDFKNNYLLVSTPSRTNADFFVDCIRGIIGSLPVTPVIQGNAAEILTSWLKSKNLGLDDVIPNDFTILDNILELVDNRKNCNKVLFYNQELTSSEVIKHLHNSKLVSKISLSWDDKIQFSLSTDNINLTKIKFINIEEEQEKNSDDATQIDSDFAIMTSEFRALIGRILEEIK